MSKTSEGHDPCISNLPGVKNACCGHGLKKGAYIHFEDDSVIRDEEDITYIKQLKNEI